MRKKIKKKFKNLKLETNRFLNNYVFKYFNHFILNKEQIPPKEYLNGVDDVLNLDNIEFIKVFDETKITLQKPKSVYSEDSTIFYLKELKYPEDCIFTFNEAYVYGNDGIVLTSEKKVINRLNIHFNHIGPFENHEIFSRLVMPKPRHIKGSVAVLTSLWADFYYHWMVDILPKFYLLEKAGIAPDYYVINSQDKRFQKYTLEKLQIPEEKIIKTTPDMHIKANKLIVPTIPGFTGHNPKWALDFIKEKFLPENKDNNYLERISISRKKAFSRRYFNQKEIDNVLAEYGFVDLVLEDLSVEEQALYFNNAEIIIGPHGGGMTNILFCNQDTKIIEIFSPQMPINCYNNMANTLNLDYSYIMGDPLKGTVKKDGVKYNEQDITVDVDTLKKTLELAINP